MLRHAVAVLVIVATVVVVPRAEAADPTAQAFVDTVALASTAIPGVVPEVRKNLEALDLGRCYRLVDKKMPERALESWVEVVVYGPIQAGFAPALPTMQAIVRGLDAIPTNDPALKSGRAAWRATAEAIAQLRPLDAPCAKLAAWKKKGWARSARPKLLPPGIDDAMNTLLGDEVERKFNRAVKRLRQLGISEKDADLWSGETSFEPIGDVVEEILDEAVGDTDEVGEGSDIPFAARR